MISYNTGINAESFYMAGNGAVFIDWGDGTPIREYSLEKINGDNSIIFSNNDYYRFRYSYNIISSSYTITITGENITHFGKFGSGMGSKLDLSNNTALKFLELWGCLIEKLDVSKNIELTEIICANSFLSQLDVSNNIALKKLHCYRSWISDLDLSNNIALEELDVSENDMSTESLNRMFETLHSNDTLNVLNKKVYINDNPGVKDCDKTIAEKKGWHVYSKYY